MSTPEAVSVGRLALDGIVDVKADVPRVVLEPFPFGLYTVIVCIGYNALPRFNARSKTAGAAVIACAVMYAVAVVHFAVDVHWLAANVARSHKLADIAATCLDALGAGGASASCFYGSDYDILEAALAPAEQGKEWATTMLLDINIILSTGILLWRAWTETVRRRLMAWLWGVSFVTIFAIYIAGTAFDGAVDGISIVATFITWLLLVWIAILGVQRIQRDRSISKQMQALSHWNQVSSVVRLAFESGVLYALLWTVLAAWCTTIWETWSLPENGLSAGGSAFASAMRAFVRGPLVDVVGSYATLTLVLCERREPSPSRAAIADSNLHAHVRDSCATVVAHGGAGGDAKENWDEERGVGSENARMV
ncbi:hypothetical protein PsYK624_033370 [Phanerochaete sordida]|uniref:Uncharacterized protein n=1 Tax=Phanerochaete sordida TaxID=48140 RepID=A0A9P3G3L8_9APHY|nr:hypothetical protein PsYK624_033370 [Phanerochaete sordida]